MSIWRQVTHGLRGLLHRNERDREIDDEVQNYFEETTAAYRERGLSDEDARRAARQECCIRQRWQRREGLGPIPGRSA